MTINARPDGEERVRAEADRPPRQKVAARRHPGRWVAIAIVILLIIQLAVSMATNPAFRWSTFGQYFFSEPILRGLLLTIQLTVMCMAISIFFGIVIAVMRLSNNRILVVVGTGYAWFFRAVPTLVVLILIYNISALYPELSLGIPFGPVFTTFDANEIITPMVAAVAGLSISESAYMSEIVRGGILAVPRGQSEAAWSLGMTRMQALRRVILPQALRIIIPPTGNQVVGMAKMTALVSVLALGDLLYSAQRIYVRNFEPIPLLLVATAWYLVLVSVLMLLQRQLEIRLRRGQRSTLAQLGEGA